MRTLNVFAELKPQYLWRSRGWSYFVGLKKAQMNWEMLTAVGQLAAVLVGVPSLIYLAIQIREQTKERRQAAVNALTVQWGDLARALHDSAEFSAIYLRGLQSFSDLDAVSKAQV